MRIAIIDPAAGISGDMTLGALLSLGVPASWLQELPARLGLANVGVTVRDVRRAGVGCKQVEFAIPEQPHGRHVGELVRLVQGASVSDWVKERAVRAFRLVGEAEGKVHGVAPEKVHLHEVGAVDAVLDIVGAIEGFERLGVDAVYHWPVAVGTGWVEAVHGKLPGAAPPTALVLGGLQVAAEEKKGASGLRGGGDDAGAAGGGGDRRIVPPQHDRGCAALGGGAGDAAAASSDSTTGRRGRPGEGVGAGGRRWGTGEA